MIRQIKYISLYFILLTLFPLLVNAQKLEQNPELIKGKLSNGLTYYIYPNQYPKGEAVYRLFIKSGSVFETDAQKGLAHFLEHMAFNGTKHFPNDGVIRFLESKGAKFGKDLNAHTSFNETVYKLQLPTQPQALVDSTMTILADWAGNLSLEGVEIDKERGVIMSEWLSKIGPKYDIQNAFLLELLNNSRFSERIVIGDTAVIKNCAHDEIRNYYKNWYDPSVMAIAVVGDINADEIESMIKNKFGGFESVLKGKKVPTYGIDDYKKMEVKIMTEESLNKIELNVIQMLPLMPGVKTVKDYDAYLERSILNRLIKARFSAHAFENQPYKKATHGISNFLNTKGVLLSSVELIPEKIQEGIDAYVFQLEQIYRYGFIPLEIEKVKKSYLAAMKRKAESKQPTASMSIMDEIYSEFYAENAIITPELEYELALKSIAKIDSVSMIKLLIQTVNWNKSHLFMTAFDKVKDQLPSESELLETFKSIQKKDIAPYTKDVIIPDNLLTDLPTTGSIKDRKSIKEIDVEQITLSNGASIIFKRSVDSKERIMLSGFRKGGLYALDSTEYVSGVFAGSVIALSGAGEFTRDALSHYLTGNTASMRFLIEKTRTGVVGGSSNDDKETLFQLLYLKWTEPRLDAKIYDQVKEKSIESYRTANKTKADEFQIDLAKILQGESYVNREMTDTIINNELHKDKLIPIYNKAFGSAKDYTFIIIADCNFSDIEDLVLQYIGGLPAYDTPTEYVYERPKSLKESLTFERKDGHNPKATASLIFQKYSLQEEDLRLGMLKEEMFKSVARMKLLKVLREDMGMVYSVGVSAGTTIHPSTLSRRTIGFNCLPENVDTLVAKTLEVLHSLIDNPSSFDSELLDVKTNMKKEMKLNVQKDSYWSAFIRNTIFNNQTDWNYLNNYEKLVDSITNEQISSFIKQEVINSPMVKAILLPKDNVEKQD